jgi:hypothetical protein
MSSSRMALNIASVYLVDDMADPKIPHSEKRTYRDLSRQDRKSCILLLRFATHCDRLLSH